MRSWQGLLLWTGLGAVGLAGLVFTLGALLLDRRKEDSIGMAVLIGITAFSLLLAGAFAVILALVGMAARRPPTTATVYFWGLAGIALFVAPLALDPGDVAAQYAFLVAWPLALLATAVAVISAVRWRRGQRVGGHLLARQTS